MSVDDTSVNHMVIASALQPRGLTVTVCLSGEEALEKIANRGFLPDCILMDCLMPGGMDGFETCRKLRDLFPSNNLPMIMVSGLGQEQDVAKSLEAGCSDYIRKPFSISELNEHVDAQLKMKQVKGIACLSLRDVAIRFLLSDELVLGTLGLVA
jgi:two-component system sensor histidine kinase ChiS